MSLVRTRRRMQQMIKWVWAFVGVFIVGIFLSFNFAANQPSAQTGAGGGILAKIDGETVPVQEFDTLVRQYRDMFGRPGVQQLSQIPRYAWEQILTSRAQAAAARANGISVSSGEVGAEIDRQINDRLKNVAQGASKEDLENAKFQMRALMPRDAVQRQLEAQRLRDRLTQEARPVEVKVAHILVKTDKRSDAEALKLAESYARQAKTGADFAKLAREHSEDQGSKVKDGMVGWASAMPGGPAPTDMVAGDDKKKKAPAREPATNFVPEFTSASLRLKVNEVSNPVKSQFGYHVIKALETRDYEPPAETPAATARKGPKAPTTPAADPKKRQEAIDSYRQAAGNAIAEGIFAEYKARARVEAEHPWLKGHLAEEQANANLMSTVQSGKPVDQATRMKPAIEAYTAALKAGGSWAGSGLAYKLAQLYQNANQPEQAVAVLEKEVRPYSDPELHFAYGEALMKLKTPRKTDALQAFQLALKQSKSDTGLLGRLTDKFKELGRNDLAEEARTKQTTILAQQEKERKEYEEQQKKAAAAATAPKKDEPVAEVTVKTGDIDPKTGKPKILSVTTTKPGEKKGQGPAAPAKDEKTPGAADKGSAKP